MRSSTKIIFLVLNREILISDFFCVSQIPNKYPPLWHLSIKKTVIILKMFQANAVCIQFELCVFFACKSFTKSGYRTTVRSEGPAAPFFFLIPQNPRPPPVGPLRHAHLVLCVDQYGEPAQCHCARHRCISCHSAALSPDWKYIHLRSADFFPWFMLESGAGFVAKLAFNPRRPRSSTVDGRPQGLNPFKICDRKHSYVQASETTPHVSQWLIFLPATYIVCFFVSTFCSVCFLFSVLCFSSLDDFNLRSQSLFSVVCVHPNLYSEELSFDHTTFP